MTTLVKLTSVTLPTADYPNLLDFTGPDLPVKTGLQGLFQLGGTIEESLVNLAGGSAATAVGSPTINTFGATLTPTNCIDTGIASASEITLILVAKPVKYSETSINSSALTNYYTNGTVTEGDSLFFWNSSGDNVVRQWGDVDSGASTGPASSVVINGLNSANYGFFAGKVYNATKSKVFSGSGGTLTTGTEGNLALTRAVSTRTFRIGGHYAGAGFGTPLTACLAAVYHTALTDGQIASVYDYLRTEWAPAMGVSTL